MIVNNSPQISNRKYTLSGLAAAVDDATVYTFLNANQNNPKVVYDAVYAYNVPMAQLTRVSGWTEAAAAEFLRAGAAGVTDWAAYKRSQNGSSSPPPAPAPAPTPAPQVSTPTPPPPPSSTSSSNSRIGQIRAYLDQIPQNRPDLVYQFAVQYQVSPEEIAQASNLPLSAVRAFLSRGETMVNGTSSSGSSPPAPAPASSTSVDYSNSFQHTGNGNEFTAIDGEWYKSPTVIAAAVGALALIYASKKKG